MLNMIERTHLQQLIKRINEPRRFIQVIMGPRQVGKTTLASQLIKKVNIPSWYESADAIPGGNVQWLEQIWEAARIKMKMLKARDFILVVDEIQKIQGWSETVKRLWDEDSFNGIEMKII